MSVIIANGKAEAVKPEKKAEEPKKETKKATAKSAK